MPDFDDANTFDLAPVSLFLEDLSGLKKLFAQWSQNSTISVRDHLQDHPDCVLEAMRAIRILKVNRKTLSLYEADDLMHLIKHFHSVLSIETIATMIEQIVGLWEGGQDFFAKTVNQTVTGRRLDIQLRGNILPGYEQSWSRVLVAVEDVSDLQIARREMARSEAYALGLFEHSPVSLLVKDYSGIRPLFEELRQRGVQSIEPYVDSDSTFFGRCMKAVRFVVMNHKTFQLFGMPEGTVLGQRHIDLWRANLSIGLREELIGLWNGELFQQREAINIKLDGDQVHVHVQFSVLPGHETDWSRIQAARIDLTRRKVAEQRLRYLRDHDSLTGLHSRAFYNEQLRSLEAANQAIVIIAADLDGLKEANDRLGHAEGDKMLQRTGEILMEGVAAPWVAARMGGDEFVILMPGAVESDGIQMMAQIQARVVAANQGWGGIPLSLSLGAAIRHPEERLESTVNRADAQMYEAKRRHYAADRTDRLSRTNVPCDRRGDI